MGFETLACAALGTADFRTAAATSDLLTKDVAILLVKLGDRASLCWLLTRESSLLQERKDVS